MSDVDFGTFHFDGVTFIVFRSNTDDWRWTDFDKSPAMPTYLLTVVITDYEFVHVVYRASGRPVHMRFWATKHHLPALNQTIKSTPKLLHYLESFVQEPYSLPKIDFISIPSNMPFAAMENWGRII